MSASFRNLGRRSTRVAAVGKTNARAGNNDDIASVLLHVDECASSRPVPLTSVRTGKELIRNVFPKENRIHPVPGPSILRANNVRVHVTRTHANTRSTLRATEDNGVSPGSSSLINSFGYYRPSIIDENSRVTYNDGGNVNAFLAEWNIVLLVGDNGVYTYSDCLNRRTFSVTEKHRRNRKDSNLHCYINLRVLNDLPEMFPSRLNSIFRLSPWSSPIIERKRYTHSMFTYKST